MVAHDGPAGARFSAHKFTSTNHWALSGNAWAGRWRPSGSRLWAQFWVSFTPIQDRSPATAGPMSALVGTLTDGGERWCAVLESV